MGGKESAPRLGCHTPLAFLFPGPPFWIEDKQRGAPRSLHYLALSFACGVLTPMWATWGRDAGRGVVHRCRSSCELYCRGSTVLVMVLLPGSECLWIIPFRTQRFVGAEKDRLCRCPLLIRTHIMTCEAFDTAALAWFFPTD